MKDSWIKLYRKTSDNGIMKDHLAWVLFSWLLLRVDKTTGKTKLGRYQIADELGIKPNTVYKILHRLDKKWGVCQMSSQKKYTEVFIVNWDKYQHQERDASNESQMTVKKPSNESNTIQEIENKRIENILPERSADPPEKAKNLEKPPNKKDLYQSIIAYCREKQGISREYPNYVKQTTALKKIFGSGYSEPEVKFVIEEMSKDSFWQESPFDLMTVANQMHKYLNRTVLFKKGGQRAFN